MQSLIRAVRSVRSQCRISSSRHTLAAFDSVNVETNDFFGQNFHSVRSFNSLSIVASSQGRKLSREGASVYGYGAVSSSFSNGSAKFGTYHGAAFSAMFPGRCLSTAVNPVESVSYDSTAPEVDVPTRIKFKRLDKTARNIMQIIDKEAVEEVRAQRDIPDIKPGYIIQLKSEVPENKRRVTTIKGIVIARRNAGLNSTFRLRRLVAGVGVESLLPLYSPNIKEIKVLDKKKVRRAKLYYLREKMNALRK